MIQKILTPVDNSSRAESALTYAITEHPTATLTAIYVVRPPEGYYAAFIDTPEESPDYRLEQAQGAALLTQLKAKAAKQDVDLQTVLTMGKPAATISAYAEEEEFDQILLGSQHRGFVSRVLRSSVPAAIARRSRVPTTIVHAEPTLRETPTKPMSA